ncbi:MAG: PepSY domain-containing protein [Gemmatimonadaceae bacterium]|nr:PepSY domain-containing protein [Gemmatimonadaceae bacterium]
MTPAFWRRWHRWIGFPAAIFLLFASITGMLVAGTEFFGEEEALRERTRDLVSPTTSASPSDQWSVPIQRAVAAVTAQDGARPIDKIEVQFKGDNPTVTIFTGKPTGGEDRRYVVSARTGTVVSSGSYVDKPLLHRLHSGEALGDGGLVVAMTWGFCLALLTISGLAIFWRMRRRDATGFRRYFW